MKRYVAAAWIWLPILFGARIVDAAGNSSRRVGKTPPNVVVEDRAGTKRRLPILKSYPDGLGDSGPESYISRIVFVPDGRSRLKRMVTRSAYPGSTAESKTYTERMVDFMILTLLEGAPHRFPRGSKLQWVQVKGSMLRLSLNRAFAQADFWRNKTQARATLYAIVNTALEHDYAGAKRVQILIEGKPIARLGSIRTDKPLAPRLSLVSGP